MHNLMTTMASQTDASFHAIQTHESALEEAVSALERALAGRHFYLGIKSLSHYYTASFDGQAMRYMLLK